MVAFPSTTADDADANDFATETVADALFNRDVAMMGVGNQDFAFGDSTTTSATYADISGTSFAKVIPNFATQTGGARYYHITLDAWVTGGAAPSGDIRFRDSDTPTNGTAVTGITTGSGGTFQILGVDVDTLGGTLVNFVVQGQVSGGGTLHVRCSGVAGYYFSDTDDTGAA